MNSDFLKNHASQQHCNNFASSRLSTMLHWHCTVYVSYPQLSEWTHLQLEIAQLVAHKMGKSIPCVRGGYEVLHRLLDGTGVIGCAAWLFALYISQIRICCIFITWCYASAVYTMVMYPSVWYEWCVPAAEWLELPAVIMAQLAHTAGKSIFCCKWWQCGSSQMTLGRTCQYSIWECSGSRRQDRPLPRRQIIKSENHEEVERHSKLFCLTLTSNSNKSSKCYIGIKSQCHEVWKYLKAG